MTEKKWSKDITEHSDALDLEDDVFKKDDPKDIARSLKRSADRSERRKGTPLQSAMGMLTFYINRAGENLSDERRKTLEQAKDELRALFDHRYPVTGSPAVALLHLQSGETTWPIKTLTAAPSLSSPARRRQWH